VISFYYLTLTRAPEQEPSLELAAVAAVLSQIYVDLSMKNTGFYLRMTNIKKIPSGFAGD
jgi:hypothetical protein